MNFLALRHLSSLLLVVILYLLLKLLIISFLLIQDLIFELENLRKAHHKLFK